jgi:transketolase
MHGEAMGNEEIAATRLNLGWTSPPFEIPEDIRAAWDMREKGARAEQDGAPALPPTERISGARGRVRAAHGGRSAGGFGELIDAYIGAAQAEGKALASRQSSQAALNAIGPRCPSCWAARPTSRPRTAPCARIRCR